jgi:hypothetical protein
VPNPAALIRRLREERRELGWGGLLKKRGWVMVAVFVLFYIVRDSLLYIVLPMAAAGMRP